MFFAALVVAVASFAAPAKTPTKNDLLDVYEPGQLCVCVYFEEEVCNDVVFAGSYNEWNTGDPASMAKFKTLEGFEGWYYVAVTDKSAEIQGKPVQLMGDGSFSWDYQTGDPASWTIVSGTVNISAGYDGEADLKGYSTTEPVILISAYFKNHNTPCGYVAEYKDYTIRLNAPYCADAEGNYFDPAIIGDFNGWSEGVAANTIDEETFEYIFELKGAEKTKAFKFKALGDTDWSNQIQLLEVDAEGNPVLDENGAEKWYDNPNLTLGDETTITIDYSAGKFTLCVDGVESAVENAEVEKATAVKSIKNGQMVIEMNGKIFNILGAEVK